VSLVIREATSQDLETCVGMDGSTTADHVWQITQRDQADQIHIMLSDVRLPRPTQVDYPHTAADIIEQWKRVDVLLVAEEGGRVIGFADALAETWHDLAIVRNLIVSAAFRRRGVGTALIGAVNHWAHDRGLGVLLVEAHSQNSPAICLYQKLGFVFAGFNDRYYRDRIAFFFARGVR